ncbi:MAG: molybdenum cofactor biosynthesis protein MoaE [Alphaproteobacteria bacterium]|nr:molybdenum cofactor biosynthesis protein MoaE [Alphaproteobacteria bacterium]
MIRVQKEDFDVGAELKALIERARADGAGIGGIVTFTGVVREFSSEAGYRGGPRQLTAMTLEHYPGMTQRQLADIEADARKRWPIDASLIIHRYGRLEPGDNIVLVITASAHRQAAFEANEFLVDWLKTKAPFWKQECGPGGETWVAAKASDDQMAERWIRKPAAKRSAAE